MYACVTLVSHDMMDRETLATQMSHMHTKLHVSFAKYRLFRRALLQKRPIMYYAYTYPSDTQTHATAVDMIEGGEDS